MFDFEEEIKNEINKIVDQKESNIKIINHPERFFEKSNQERKEINMAQELEPWKPFREVVSLRNAMDRLFEDSVITPKETALMPKIDIKDKKDRIEVSAELPGMKEEDIDVEVSEGIMTISGQKTQEKEEKEEGYYYKESHSGAFSRSFALPADVVADKASAEMEKGVLVVTIPKVAEKKAKRVKILAKKK